MGQHLRPGHTCVGGRYKNFHGQIPMSKNKVAHSRKLDNYIREMFKPSAHATVRQWIDALPDEDFNHFAGVIRAISCVVEEAHHQIP